MYPLTAMIAFAFTRGFSTAIPDESLRHRTTHWATGRAHAQARADEAHFKDLRSEGDFPAAIRGTGDAER